MCVVVRVRVWFSVKVRDRVSFGIRVSVRIKVYG